LGHALSWPDASPLGGLNEKGLLPISRSPKSSLLKNLLTNKLDIPHEIVEFSAGDVIIFDDRLLHSVFAPILPKPRRLITMLFTEYLSESKKSILSSDDLSIDKINSEIISLKQMECNQYSCDAYPSKLVDFIKNKGRFNNIEKLISIKPVSQKNYDGLHKGQHKELRDFLVNNYRDVN
jgi:hypothetical protein